MGASSLAVAQKAPLIADGYYTLTPIAQETAGMVYSYDTDASRNPYGNLVDYAHPAGRNGEYAYLYSVRSTSATLANTALYFSNNPDGSYTVQSCSGEPYSYLDIAGYDRHLLKFSIMPRASFHLHGQYDDMSSLPANEHIMQQLQNAAIYDSLASDARNLSSLHVLFPVDAEKITPAFSIRRTLSDARGVLALYPAGDNPGQVPALLSSNLQQVIAEAQTLVASKTTTAEQAEDIIQRLKDATAAYADAAPSQINPMQDGYYFVTSAYRAFMLRQSKTKVLVTEKGADGPTLRWNTGNTSDGTMAMHVTACSDGFMMQDYLGHYLSHPSTEGNTFSLLDESDGATFSFRYDTEGLWTIADTSAPESFLSAANPSVGEKGLYGKATDGDIVADGTMYLYPGYCSSWQIERAYHLLTVSSTGWASLSVSFPVEVPEGMDVYTVTEMGGELYLMPYLRDVIPARTAVVVHAAKGSYTFWSTTEDVPAVDDNALVANCENLTGMEAGSMATLKVKNGVAGFSKTTAKTLAAGATYIPYVAGQDDFRPLKEDADAIRGVNAGDSEGEARDGDVYDLLGRKVARPIGKAGKGLYIMNNKKILK